MKSVKALVATAVLASLTGCASIVTDGTAMVNLTTSNGDKTTVTIDGQVYQAPGIVSVMKNGENKIVVADTETCKGQTVMPKKIELAFFGNIISGGLFGSTTDYSTDKMWTYGDSTVINCGS